MRRPSITPRRIDGLAAIADRIEPTVAAMKGKRVENLFAYPAAERERIRKGLKLIRQLTAWQAGRKA